MSLAVCFWVLMLIAFVLSAWGSWPVSRGNIQQAGISLILFLLLLILGWKVFGSPIHV